MASAEAASQHGGAFGEATSLVPHILAADFQVFPVLAIHQCLVQLGIKIVNDTAQGCMSAKLRIPLSLDATVCRFEVQHDDQWYPAIPVEAQKAKEVVYREREKGRVAAATSQVQGNVFEIELSTLAYEQVTQCRLWYSQGEIFTIEDLSFDVDTVITLNGQPMEPTALGQGLGSLAAPVPAACWGHCFGQRHFACYVPFVSAEESSAPSHIAVVWDTSGSQSYDHSERFAGLRALAGECTSARFDLWTLDVSSQKVRTDMGIDDLIQELGTLRHDGGTDLSQLTCVLAEARAAGIDAVLLFSDGMDSLGRLPPIPDAWPPIHAIVDSAKANTQALRMLCQASGGQLLSGDCDYLQLLKPQTLLTKISTDQSEDGFCDPADAFQCSPDHRLSSMHVPINADGLWICGTLGAVTKITAEITAGSLHRDFTFDLTASENLGPDAASLLGYVYARQLYAAVERDGAAMGMDLSAVCEDLALRYGFCSPTSSLMMLHEPRQFLENKVPCPADHPAHAAWKVEVAKQADAAAGVASPEADIGRPKTEAQMQQVAILAKRLQAFIAEPVPESTAAPALPSSSAAGAASAPEPEASAPEAPAPVPEAPVPEAPEASAPEAPAPVPEAPVPEAAPANTLKRSTSAPVAPTPREPFDSLLDEAKCFQSSELNARARQAYEEALEMAQRELAPTHPIRLGVVLNYSVFLKETGETERAMELAREGFEDSIAELDNVAEDSYRDSTLVMQLMRDNLTMWSGDAPAASAPAASEPAAGAAAEPDFGAFGDAVATACEAYVGGQEQSYLPALQAALQKGTWREVYASLRLEHASSPSFFLYSASEILRHSAEQAAFAVRVCTNCLEMNIQDAQMLRSVGYFLMRAGSWDLALLVFDRVRGLAPLEPQSFLDAALVRTFQLRSSFDEGKLKEAVELTAVAITHTWAQRFAEVEWPALVLLHLLVALGERNGLEELWPLDARLRCPDFELGLVIWLGWDTDKTDIDLHVVEPSSNEVYYSNPRSPIGGRLSKDFTQGYGPEVYLLKKPPRGTYTVRVKYFASHQQSALTGATSAVVWAMRGDCLQFETVRLTANQQKIDVMDVSC